MSFNDGTPVRSSVFRLGQRGKTWFITRDNVFYGDYASRDQAVNAASFAARAVEARGGVAQVLAIPGDVVVPHSPKVAAKAPAKAPAKAKRSKT
ncbi:MAG: hypothetical protein E7812_17090 [Phenylobacterium sp.]|nr:MAG: hypothetical protein E7812_17090 [Phenylobacterium sp.]